MSAIKCVLVLTLFIINLEISWSLYCYWNTGCPYKYLSSKTPYNFIRGDIRDSRVRIKGCEPISVWSIMRHGQRWPSDGYYKPMTEVLSIRNDVIASHAAGKSSLCAQDVENLKNWIDNLKTYKLTSLTPEGYKEMNDLGKRFQQAFPKLLVNLEERDYIVHPSWGSRNEDSVKAYIAGFTDSKLSYKKPRQEFDEIAPYATCERYEKMVRGNPETYAEADKYLFNSEYLATKDRIQRRLGIDYILSDENITALYDICRYDSSGYSNNLSPWCALFTTDDLIVLEYIGDLRHYYRNGYGTEMANKLGHLPLQNLLKTFKQAKEGKGKKLTSFVSHATIIDMIYTAMGLFKDLKPLTGEHRNPDRKWRSCKMSTFSSNLVAVLNRCTMDHEEYNVIFYLNEEPFLSICKEGVCTWQEFEEKFTFDDFSLDFCNMTSNVEKTRP